MRVLIFEQPLQMHVLPGRLVIDLATRIVFFALRLSMTVLENRKLAEGLPAND